MLCYSFLTIFVIDMTIKLTPISEQHRKRKPSPGSSLGFGRIYSDHMFVSRWHRGRGWDAGEITGFGDLSLSPAALVLHYGQTIFEGLKAYRAESGGINLFRPKMNWERMVRSAARLDLPGPPDYAIFLEAIGHLVNLDRDWIPHGEGESLYLRPTMIATEPYIGLKSSDEALFYIITGPVGAYYADDFKPTRIMISEHYCRTARNGLGAAKTAANYAASLLAARHAMERGYDQVLWLDAESGRYVEEVGSMNIFFRIDGVVHTPTLESGTILAGVTRDSVIRLMRHWGIIVEERRITVDEIVEASETGGLEEIFGCGTAAIINPVSCFSYRDRDFVIPVQGNDSLSKRLFDCLSAIQYGRRDGFDDGDFADWVVNLQPSGSLLRRGI